MATDYILKKSIFLHVPKTGGSWVKAVLLQSTDLVVERGGNWHSIPEGKAYPGKFRFAFVRHPLTWYQSFWAFNMKLNKWNKGPCRSLGSCKSPDFNVFVSNVVGKFPKGFLSSYLYPKFTGAANFVGRYENLTEDLILALTKAKETFDPEKIRAMSSYKRNVAASDDAWKDKCRYRDELSERLLKAEQKVVERYYNGR